MYAQLDKVASGIQRLEERIWQVEKDVDDPYFWEHKVTCFSRSLGALFLAPYLSLSLPLPIPSCFFSFFVFLLPFPFFFSFFLSLFLSFLFCAGGFGPGEAGEGRCARQNDENSQKE